MSSIRLIYPVEHDGALHRSVDIRRPGPIRFARYWRRRHVPGPPPFDVSLPWSVVDRLNPADHRRVIAEMKRLTMPYIWFRGVWKFCFKKKGLQS